MNENIMYAILPPGLSLDPQSLVRISNNPASPTLLFNNTIDASDWLNLQSFSNKQYYSIVEVTILSLRKLNNV